MGTVQISYHAIKGGVATGVKKDFFNVIYNSKTY